MTTANINEFKANIQGGGARANQFQVFLNTPPGVAATGLDAGRDAFLIKATSLPGQTITEVPVPFRGRTLYLAGDREFETWTTTVIAETDFVIRNGIEIWMSAINDLETSQGLTRFSDYAADLRVEQLDRSNNVLKAYVLKNCWPTAVTQMDLSFDTVSEVSQFDVTWRYTDFTSVGV
tara:strand:+ start:624 stop:1157 length:534 start_codon:yes stop_codon:yes gene_type:complete